LTQFLPDASVLNLEAPQYPVDIQYVPSEPRKYLEIRVREALGLARAQAPAGLRGGDALVFLPGMVEIRRCAEELEKSFGKQNLILPLHGELPREQQTKVFQKADRPKVILATNVAETSLTIEGITLVIDSGLHRQASYSWWNGIPSLKTRPISKASATQRAGRAGRTGPGICYRLYSKADWESRLAFETPEIRRSELTPTFLEIKAMGVERMGVFPWFEAPSAGALQSSAELLFQLGALENADLDAALTPLGKRMSEIPVHPRLARMLLEAEARSCLGEAAKLAALIGEDALEGLDVFHQLETGRPPESARRLQQVLLAGFPKVKSADKGGDEDLAYALLTGFPDRVAKRRAGSASTEKQRQIKQSREVELVFSNGGAGTVQAETNLEGDFFVVLEVQEKQFHGQTRPKVHVTSLAPIHPEWLFDWQGSLLQEKEELLWDDRLGKIVQISRILYGQLVMTEQRGEPRDAQAAEKAFFQTALGLALEGPEAEKLNVPRFLEIISKHVDPAVLEETLSRIQLLGKIQPMAEMPTFEGLGLSGFLLKAFAGISSRRQMEDGALAQGLVQALPAAASSRLAAMFPMQVALQAGRKVKVHYGWNKEPWIESRLQDFFGMSQGPSLAGGRVPLLLHLQGPNRRAVQVTQDLASFWKNTYPQVRQELKRRYPRHAWPENPTTAD